MENHQGKKSEHLGPNETQRIMPMSRAPENEETNRLQSETQVQHKKPNETQRVRRTSREPNGPETDEFDYDLGEFIDVLGRARYTVMGSDGYVRMNLKVRQLSKAGDDWTIELFNPEDPDSASDAVTMTFGEFEKLRQRSMAAPLLEDQAMQHQNYPDRVKSVLGDHDFVHETPTPAPQPKSEPLPHEEHGPAGRKMKLPAARVHASEEDASDMFSRIQQWDSDFKHSAQKALREDEEFKTAEVLDFKSLLGLPGYDGDDFELTVQVGDSSDKNVGGEGSNIIKILVRRVADESLQGG